MASNLDKEVQFKIGGVFVSHEFANGAGDDTETDTDVENEEDDAVSVPTCNNSQMMYSIQDIDAKIIREQEKAKKQWRRKKQSYLAQMSLMQQKIDKLEQKKSEFEVKNKEVEGIICEFEKTAEAVAEEKESQIYELVQERQRLQTQTNELKVKNAAVKDKIQTGLEQMGLLDTQHRERLDELQRTQQQAKQKVQSKMAEHQKVIDSASERAQQHKRVAAEGEATKENLQTAQKDAKARLESVRSEVQSALRMVKSQRDGAQRALLELRQNVVSVMQEHKALTQSMPTLITSKDEWTRRHELVCQQNTRMQQEREQHKQKLSTLVAAKKTAVLESYRWGEDRDKQMAKLEKERAKTSELVDIRNQLEQQRTLRS